MLEAIIFVMSSCLIWIREEKLMTTSHLTPDQQAALKELMNLVADHGIIVRFEDKGSWFVLDTIANHDAALLED